MGIISSIFGDRASAPQTGGFTVGAEIPKELAPYYKDILGKSQALYNDSVSQGFKPYTGPSLAEFTPEQQQAFAGISGLQGQQAPIYQEAMGMTRDASAPITTEEITEYMNPYQQAVVDIEKREATKQYQSQVQPQLAAQAARIQPFGGSRQAILEGMAADTQQRLLGDIQAKGSAQAYQDSVNLINAQRGRTGSGAGQLATLGSNQFKSQLGEIGALQTVGEEKQQLAQQALNEAYGQYSKEQEYPYQQLGRYQSVVTGAPIQQTQYVPPTPAGPSVGQQLLGGAATMLGTYGAFGGQMPNLFGAPGAVAAKGGGIAGLVKRQSGTVDANDPAERYNKYDTNNIPIPVGFVREKLDVPVAEEFVNPETLLEYKKNNQENTPSFVSSKISGLKKVLQDKMETKASRDKVMYERLSNINSPFNVDNRPSNLSEQEDFRADSPGRQDLKKAINLGARVVGTGVDLTNKGNNWINKNLNRLIKIGETYLLKPGDTSGVEYPIRTNEEAREIFNKYNIAGQNIPLSKEIQAEQTEKLYEDKRPGRNEGFVAEAENVIEQGQESGNLPKISEFFNKPILASTSEIKEVLAFDGGSFIEDFYKGIGPKVDGVKEKGENLSNTTLGNIEKLTTTFKNKNDINKNITKSDNIVKKNTKKITTTNKENNLSLKDLDKRATILANNKKKLKKAQEADKPTKKIKSDLDRAQDKYLTALKDRNDNLDGKEKLINQSKTESFWAFVARVGANISQGKPIAAAVADELPQAMKDRQKLIQAKSDLDDKKDDGSVSMAKAEMTIETADAAALAARAKEERGYKSKKELAEITASGKAKYQTLSNLSDSEGFIENVFTGYKDTLKQYPQMGTDLLKASSIKGINSSNFNKVFDQFMSDNDLKDRVYNRAKSDSQGRDRGDLDQLYRYHLNKEWEDYSGEFRDGDWFGRPKVRRYK